MSTRPIIQQGLNVYILQRERVELYVVVGSCSYLLSSFIVVSKFWRSWRKSTYWQLDFNFKNAKHKSIHEEICCCHVRCHIYLQSEVERSTKPSKHSSTCREESSNVWINDKKGILCLVFITWRLCRQMLRKQSL